MFDLTSICENGVKEITNDHLNHRFETIEEKQDFYIEELMDKFNAMREQAVAALGLTMVDMSLDQIRTIEEYVINTITILEREPKKKHYREMKDGVWVNYKNHLVSNKKFEIDTINSLDESTTRVVNHLDKPHKRKPQDISNYGLVVGEIQSGKTTHMFGLIAKLIDQGFDIVIVFTGTIDILRIQTQVRLEEDLFGRNTENGERIGVSLVNKNYDPNFRFMSSRTNDIKKGQKQANSFIGIDRPVIYCAKKGKAQLEAINELIEYANENNKSVVVIDDESDYASINTRNDDSEPTVTNAEIRKVLKQFKRSYYIAYTATPFANMFISKDKNSEVLEADLYPKTFIELIAKNDYYTGFEAFLPLDDSEENIVQECYHRGDKELYQEAILDYIVSVSYREVAKNTRSNLSEYATMMFNEHVNIDRNEALFDEVDDILRNFQTQFSFQKELITPLIDRIVKKRNSIIKKYHNSHFELTSNDVINIINSIDFFENYKLVRAYSNYKEEAFGEQEFVIIIGGFKLSRGLTIEGLLTCVITRNISTQSDSLSQFARWCGYRSGYIDLMSLYTNKDSINGYNEVISLNEELKDQVEQMNEGEYSPSEFRFSFRLPGSKMKVSSASKLRAAKYSIDDYSGEPVQQLRLDPLKRETNINLLNNTLSQYRSEKFKHGYFYASITPTDVIRFLEKYRNLNNGEYMYNTKTDITNWVNYIKKANGINELTNWNIVIKSNVNNSSGSFLIDDNQINLTGIKYGRDIKKGVAKFNAITYEIDEYLDHIYLDEFEYNLDNHKRDKARKMRHPQNRLLVITFVKDIEGGLPYYSISISFPHSNNNEITRGKVISN